MAELLFRLRTAHGAMSSQPELLVSEGLAGTEELLPGWVIYIQMASMPHFLAGVL